MSKREGWSEDTPRMHSVRTSQASRDDAKPVTFTDRFETYEDEMSHWVAIKKQLELSLCKYSPAGMSKRQSEIRRENGGTTDKAFHAWLKEKAKLEGERQELIAKLREVEMEILRVKPLLKAENIRKHASVRQTQDHHGVIHMKSIEELGRTNPVRNDGTVDYGILGANILMELQEIRLLLQSEVRRTTGR